MDSEEDYESSASETYDSGNEEDSESAESPDEKFENGENTIETSIENDFERLLGNIRVSGDISNSAVLSKVWDNPLAGHEESEAQFQADLRAASGVGKKGKGKGKGHGRRAGPPLSHELRVLIGEGNAAYVDGNLREAIRIMTEVVRIEPRVVSAYNVLSVAYKELKDDTKHLHFAILGAHLKHDAGVWRELAQQSLSLGHSQQAFYCIGKAMNLDPSNPEIISERVTIAKEIGNLPAVRNAYLALLKHFPHDVVILTGLRHVLIELGDLKHCTELYQNAFDHYSAMFPSAKVATSNLGSFPGTIDPALADSGSESVSFGLMELLVLADTYNGLGEHEKAIKAVRAGCRWLQGRAAQKYWDACPDDREYDTPGFVRYVTSENQPMQQGFFPLDVNARHRLAIARLKLGDLDEGRMHATVVLAEDEAEFVHLFLEIADTFFENGMFEDARPIYESLGADASTSSLHVLMQVADCRLNMGESREAAELYEHIIKIDPSNNTAKKRLAEIYEANGQLRRALDLLYQVIDSRKRQGESTAEGDAPDDDGPASSLFAERKRGRPKKDSSQKKPTMSRSEAQQLEAKKERECATYFGATDKLMDAMRSGDKEAEDAWLVNAEKLLEMFRETRALFPAASSRSFRGVIQTRKKRNDDKAQNEDSMVSRLQAALEDEKEAKKGARASFDKEVVHFRGRHFDEWLALAMDYAFLCSRRDQFDIAEDLLRHLLYAIVYQRQRYQDTIRISLATCAMYVRRHDVVLEVFRKLMLIRQFNNEPIRLFLACLASGLAQADTFVNTTLQKFLLREMRTHAAAVDGTVYWVPSLKRYTMNSSVGKEDVEEGDEEGAGVEAEKGIPPKPTKHNPMIALVYGQSLCVAKSFQSAIFYLLHAYDYYPDDPVLCLSLGLASLGRAMQRQADNRNYLVIQCMAFMERYRSLRRAGDDDAHADEIEYNFGRAFHHVGLLTYAVKHYEAALRIVEKKRQAQKDYIGVAREAAYNLSLVFTTTGAAPLADEVISRWLSV